MILEPGGGEPREIPMRFEGRPGNKDRGSVWLDPRSLVLLCCSTTANG
ncbi:MAG: hypothetical protein R2862_10075 [Thermoanaerobaculia bacterium]